MPESSATKELTSPLQTLLQLEEKQATGGFDQVVSLENTEANEAASIVWGQHEGIETPRVLLFALPKERWGEVQAEFVQSRSWGVLPPDTRQEEYPQFAVVTDGEHELIFDINYPAHEIDRLPALAEINDYKRIKSDPTRRWSMRMYDRLMKGFNAFHEQVYQTVKDRVSNKNDIILEVAKILFLESFRLHHQGKALEFKHQDRTLRLDRVFTAAYVREHEKQAVAEIKAAFDHFKEHRDYVVTDDAGEHHPIFDQQTHLLLSQPRNYETLLDLIQNLGPVTDNRGREVNPQGTLADIAADALGRAFDVFLRANFESKGGLGVYLTPAPVKMAMLEL